MIPVANRYEHSLRPPWPQLTPVDTAVRKATGYCTWKEAGVIYRARIQILLTHIVHIPAVEAHVLLPLLEPPAVNKIPRDRQRDCTRKPEVLRFCSCSLHFLGSFHLGNKQSLLKKHTLKSRSRPGPLGPGTESLAQGMHWLSERAVKRISKRKEMASFKNACLKKFFLWGKPYLLMTMSLLS